MCSFFYAVRKGAFRFEHETAGGAFGAELALEYLRQRATVGAYVYDLRRDPVGSYDIARLVFRQPFFLDSVQSFEQFLFS